MEKLVFTYFFEDLEQHFEELPFEYESKDKFIKDIIDKYGNKKAVVLGKYVEFANIETYLKNAIYTLADWFEENKHPVKI